MASVDFDTAFWTDPIVQELVPSTKLLFLYLFMNPHKNVACLYTITYKTIKDETGLNQKQIEDGLKELKEKKRIYYDASCQLCWVVNHVRRTYLKHYNVSPKIIKAIEKNLLSAPQSHPFVGEFLNKYNILSIPYPYPIHRVSEEPELPEPDGPQEAGEDLLREAFEVNFWTVYPSHNGKKLGKEATFKLYAALKPEDRQLVHKAVKHYRDSERVQRGIGIKDPIRFFKGRDYPDGFWREWVEPERKEQVEEGVYVDATGRRLSVG